MKKLLAFVVASSVVAQPGTAAVVSQSGTETPAYEARRTGDVVELEDRTHQVVVSVLTSVGNIAYAMTVKGQNILRFPFATPGEFKARPAGLHGIPLMAPWANRLDEQAFHANGKRYPFDMELGNVTGAIPIHGFMSWTDKWEVVETRQDGKAAWLTSRLEAFRQPSWMKQWPFAHTIEMTYRLAEGELEVRTKIINHSTEPMPVSIGYHPYFQLTDSIRDEWTITVPARTRW
ncbi:MAG: aldose 1-epimerase, partial [Acidobacteria bacterium]